MTTNITTDVVVLGAGPGGYTAAFRAADLGKKVVLIENSEIGGVCLNVGCIPTKTLLHLAKVVNEAASLEKHGINFDKPHFDIEKIRAWKNSIIKRMTTGLHSLAKRRQVQFVKGTGKFISPNEIKVQTDAEEVVVKFTSAIIAAGSEPIKLPFMPNDPRIMDSTDALEMTEIPQELLVIGGGVIGLEAATFYHAFGSKITVVEFMDQLLPGMDGDIVKPLQQTLARKQFKFILNTKVTAVDARSDGLWVSCVDKSNTPLEIMRFDSILVTVGRRPNGKSIGAEQAGIKIDDKGFVLVDRSLRTNVPNIYAIGDIIGNPMLAHKASFEGKLAAEIIAGHKKEAEFTAAHVPSVVYTDPEVAYVGMTEAELQSKGIQYGKGMFPWRANGRSLSLDRQEGVTKLLFDTASKRLLGAGIVGPNAGDLISETALAFKLGCTVDDITSTIHPHPTLAETVFMAAEVFEGTITDL